MKMTINETYISAEKNNTMLELGFIYKVRANWRDTGREDFFSGMPILDYDTTFFTDKEEAEEYARTRKPYPFSGEPAKVREVKREETREEYEARKEAEKKAKADKRLANEIAKAEKMGMSLEDYREYKRLEKNMKRHMTEMDKCYGTINAMKKEIAYQERRIAEYKAEMAKYEK